MFSFLPPEIRSPISSLNFAQLSEIRIRANKPVTVCVGGVYKYLSNYGITQNQTAALKLSFEDIEGIVLKATEYSIYTVNNCITSGYITVKGGIRIGLAGEYVMQDGQVVTIKDITSLAIRIPHEIKGCGKLLFDISQKEPSALLVISRPGFGKTTMLRDLCRLISDAHKSNILVIDERGEIAPDGIGSRFDVGQTADIIKYSDKLTAFEAAIRSMRPDIIITDELSGEADVSAVMRAVYSGVKVIASCHLSGIDDLKNKQELYKLHQNKVFDYYAQLSGSQIGALDFVYDKNFDIIYSRN